MPRPAKFDDDLILAATLRLIADGGPGAATISGIAKLLGAPVGSIYHRFRSRDLLLARLWIRTVKRFQHGFLAALADDELDRAALAAVRYNVGWSRQHLDEARVLLLYRREEVAERWPEELGDELATLNADVFAAMRDHALRRYGQAGEAEVRRVVFALVDVPYAAGRRHLIAGEPPPPAVDDLVTATCRCVLGIADGV